MGVAILNSVIFPEEVTDLKEGGRGGAMHISRKIIPGRKRQESARIRKTRGAREEGRRAELEGSRGPTPYNFVQTLAFALRWEVLIQRSLAPKLL